MILPKQSMWLTSCLVILTMTACSSLTTWEGKHHGIKYTIHKDQRNNSIVRGETGRLMYNSPELTVISDEGELMINGEHSGPVAEGDHVVITDLGTVLVNGERRGDKHTGAEALRKRLAEREAYLNQLKTDSSILPAEMATN